MRKLLNFRPLLFFALSVVVGILSANFILLGDTVTAIIVISVSFAIILFGFVYSFALKLNKKKIIITLLMILVAIMSGILAFSISFVNYESAKIGKTDSSVMAQIESVSITDNGKMYIVGDAKKMNSDEKFSYKISVFVYGESEFEIGDYVIFSGIICDTTEFYEQAFDYYDAMNGVRYRANVNADKIIKYSSSPNLFQSINLFFKNTLKNGLDEQEFSVAYGLLCGNTEFVNSEILSAFRDAGVAHVFAVSGLHIGFFAMALSFLFKKCGLKGYLKAAIICAILVLYSGVCGFGSSSIRASIMCSVTLFASASGKRYDPLSAISLSAILVLLISPFNLFCVGFLLSFGIALGIITLAPPLKRLLRFLPDKISSSLSVAIVAQIVGIPIMLAHFGKFSIISIFVNIIFVPIVGVLFNALMILTIIGGITTVPSVFLFLPNYVLKGVNFLITIFDFNAFIIVGFTTALCCFLFYFALSFSAGLFNVKTKLKWIITAVLLILSIVLSVVFGVVKDESVRGYVIGDESYQLTVISAGEDDILVVSYANPYFSTTRLKRAVNNLGVDDFEKVIFLRNDTKYPVAEIFEYVYKVVEIEEIVYCSDFSATEISQMQEDYPSIKITSAPMNFEFELETAKCNIVLGGYGFKIKGHGKSALILSTIESNSFFVRMLDGEVCDLLIMTDCQSEIKGAVGHETAVSYLPHVGVDNAYDNGNYHFKFE